MRLFDIGILEGNHWNPMHLVIHERTGEWLTHVVVLKNEQGDIWDATVGGILNHNLSDYPGRKITILRYRQQGFTIDTDKLLAWMATTQAECEGYDYSALIGFLTGLRIQDEKRWFCSELGYWLFQENGYPLTRKDRIFVYPADLYYYDRFDLVEEFIIPGEPEQPPQEPQIAGLP